MRATSNILLMLTLFLPGMPLTLGLAENVAVYDRTVEKGKSMRFECHYNATPPFYYYRFSSQYIKLPTAVEDSQSEYPWSVYAINASQNSPANVRIMPNILGKREQSLKIDSITVEYHNNIICCQGHDDVTVLSLSMICYHLNVQYSPQLMESSINNGQWILPLYPIYSQDLVMSCPLEGNPPASYQWYFEKSLGNSKLDDGVQIQPNNDLNITLLNNNRTLFIEFKEEHNGHYICCAKNSLGNMTYSSFPPVEVQKCTAFDPAKPSVTINASHNLVAYVGEDLTIDCIVASLPQSDSKVLRWYKGKRELDYERTAATGTRVYYLEGSYDKVHCRQNITLNIKNLTFEDSGNYSCASGVSIGRKVIDTMLLTVTVPRKQVDYKSLIIKISIPVSVVIILSVISVTLGFFYYQRVRHAKLKKALEEYQKRPLPKKGDYQYEFFFAMTEDDKLEVDKLYVVLKQSFSIYYQFDQYLPGRTKVEMVTEGIKNSRFIIIMLSKAYLQQKDEINQLELMHTMNRIEKDFTKCAFIVTLEDNLFIPYKLRHIMKFPKENADVQLKELALSSHTFGPSFVNSSPKRSVKDIVESNDIAVPLEVELLNILSSDET